MRVGRWVGWLVGIGIRRDCGIRSLLCQDSCFVLGSGNLSFDAEDMI